MNVRVRKKLIKLAFGGQEQRVNGLTPPPGGGGLNWGHLLRGRGRGGCTKMVQIR